MFKIKKHFKSLFLIIVGVVIGMLIAIVTDYPRQSIIYRLGELNKEIELNKKTIKPLKDKVFTLKREKDSLEIIIIKKEIVERDPLANQKERTDSRQKK